MKNMYLKNKGFSLTELLLVLVFIAVAIIGIFVAYQKTQSSSQASQETTNDTTLIANTKSIFNGQGNYTGLTDTVLISANAAPANMVNGASALQNVWGGAVTVTATAYNGGTANAISISEAGVPTEACVKFAGGIQAAVNQLTINAVVVQDQYASPAVTFSPSAAVTNCSGKSTVTVLLVTV